MNKNIIIDITNIYGPNDKVPGWDNNNENTGSGSSNLKDDNYGSGEGDLTVNDLNQNTTGNSGNTSIPDDNNTNVGNGSGDGNGNGSDGGDGGSGGDSEDDKDKDDPMKPDDNDEGTTNPFLDSMNKILDDAFQTLTPSTPNIMLETARGTLNIRVKSNPIKNPIEIATKVAAYFALTVVPKPMGVAGPVTSCINNATSIIPKLTQDLIALAKSGNTDYYEGFVQTLYNNIANGAIIWNVIETVPGSPPVTIPYVVTVS